MKPDTTDTRTQQRKEQETQLQKSTYQRAWQSPRRVTESEQEPGSLFDEPQPEPQLNLFGESLR